MKIISFLSLIVTASLAHALVAGPATISGTVKSFTDKAVVLENEEYKFEVPREFVAVKSLKSGEKLDVTMTLEQSGQIKSEKKKAAKK